MTTTRRLMALTRAGLIAGHPVSSLRARLTPVPES